MVRLTARRCVAGLAGSALVLASGWVAAPSASAAGTFVVSQVQYSRSSITVGGLALAPLTVTLRVQASPALPDTSPGYLAFQLDRGGGQGQLSSLVTCLSLVSGDASDAVWSGAMTVPSTANGSWSAATVWENLCAPPGVMATPHPVTGFPTLSVIGTHQPVVTFATVPDPVPLTVAAYSVAGRVIDQDTGLPYVGLTVTWAPDCNNSLAGPSAKSDATGHFVMTRRADGFSFYSFNCVVTLYATGQVFNPGYYTYQEFMTLLLAAVTAVPSQTTVRVGTIVPVNGTVTGTPAQCALALQRLHGATVWRTVSTGHVRTSGRYTLLAQPPNRGYNIYRTYMGACTVPGQGTQFAPATSRPFAITGT